MARTIDPKRVARAQAVLDEDGSYAEAGRQADVTARTIKNWLARGLLTERSSGSSVEKPVEGSVESCVESFPRHTRKQARTAPLAQRNPVAMSLGALVQRKKSQADLYRAELETRKARDALEDYQRQRKPSPVPAKVRKPKPRVDPFAAGQRVEAGVEAFCTAAGQLGIGAPETWQAKNEVRQLFRACSPRTPPHQVFGPVLRRLRTEERIQRGKGMLQAEIATWNRQCQRGDEIQSWHVRNLEKELVGRIRTSRPETPLKQIVAPVARAAKDERVAERQVREEGERDRERQAARKRWIAAQVQELNDLIEERAYSLSCGHQMDATWNIQVAEMDLKAALRSFATGSNADQTIREVVNRYLARVEAGEFDWMQSD